MLDTPVEVGDFTVTFDKDDTSFTKAVLDDKKLLSNLKKEFMRFLKHYQLLIMSLRVPR